MTMLSDLTKADELKAQREAVLAQLPFRGNGRVRACQIVAATGLGHRVVDRALQWLRKNGAAEHTNAKGESGWDRTDPASKAKRAPAAKGKASHVAKAGPDLEAAARWSVAQDRAGKGAGARARALVAKRAAWAATRRVAKAAKGGGKGSAK